MVVGCNCALKVRYLKGFFFIIKLIIICLSNMFYIIIIELKCVNSIIIFSLSPILVCIQNVTFCIVKSLLYLNSCKDM